MRARHLYVKHQAESLLSTYPNIKGPDGRVNVEALCDLHLKITVERKFFADNISGMAINNGPMKLILVNPNESPEEQAYSIAHEVGHHLLHTWKAVQYSKPLQVRYSKKDETKDFEEEEADLFASILLMPESDLRLLFKAHYQKGKETVVRILAQHFGVTAPAMDFRLRNIGLISSESTQQL